MSLEHQPILLHQLIDETLCLVLVVLSDVDEVARAELSFTYV
jgi:hypothetical protein